MKMFFKKGTYGSVGGNGVKLYLPFRFEEVLVQKI
jgi:hypothetical protein